jgi:hypothetical protein
MNPLHQTTEAKESKPTPPNQIFLPCARKMIAAAIMQLFLNINKERLIIRHTIGKSSIHKKLYGSSK